MWNIYAWLHSSVVEHRTSIAEVMGSNPVEALIFFRLLLSSCLNWKKFTAMITLHFHLIPQYKYELFHIYFTEALDSYLGLSVLSKKRFLCIKFDKGGNSLQKTFWTYCEYLLEYLNFVAFLKPNRHKMRSKGFSTTWRNLFSNTCNSQRILATFAKFCLNSLFATWSYRYPNPKHVTQRTLALPSLSHTCFFWRKKFYKILP